MYSLESNRFSLPVFPLLLYVLYVSGDSLWSVAMRNVGSHNIGSQTLRSWHCARPKDRMLLFRDREDLVSIKDAQRNVPTKISHITVAACTSLKAECFIFHCTARYFHGGFFSSKISYRALFYCGSRQRSS